MSVNNNPVPSPDSQPFSFAFFPETAPPINKAVNDRMRMNHENEASVKDVNVSNEEMIRLKDTAMTSTVIKPYSMAGNKFLYVTFSSPFLDEVLFTKAYSCFFYLESISLKC